MPYSDYVSPFIDKMVDVFHKLGNEKLIFPLDYFEKSTEIERKCCYFGISLPSF